MADKYRALKVAELKDLLAKAGLPGAGKKEELIERLVQHDQKKQEVEVDHEDLEADFGDLDGEFDDSRIDVDDLTAGAAEVDLVMPTKSDIAGGTQNGNTGDPTKANPKSTGPQQTQKVVTKASGFQYKPIVFKSNANGGEPAAESSTVKRKVSSVVPNDDFEARKMKRAEKYAKELAYELPGDAKKDAATNKSSSSAAIPEARRANAPKLIDDPDKLSKRMEKWGVINRKAAVSLGMAATNNEGSGGDPTKSTPSAKVAVDSEEEAKRLARAQRFQAQ